MSEKTPGQFVAIGFLVAGMAIGWFASSTRFKPEVSATPNAGSLSVNAQDSDAAHVEGTHADSDSAVIGPGLPGRGRDD